MFRCYLVNSDTIYLRRIVIRLVLNIMFKITSLMLDFLLFNLTSGSKLKLVCSHTLNGIKNYST